MGLDPHQNRLDREAAARKKKQAETPRLENPFPFRPTPFDPEFFAVDEDPPAAVTLTAGSGR